jgi:hypothetical protein
MKSIPFVIVVLGLHVALGAVQGASAPDVATLSASIRDGAAVLLADEPGPGKSPEKAATGLIRTASLLAHDAALPKAVQSRLEAAAAGVRDERAPDEKVAEELRSAYEALNGGRAFALPSEVKSMKALKEHGRGQVDRCLAALAAGKHQEAARELAGFLLLVLTPMEAPM